MTAITTASPIDARRTRSPSQDASDSELCVIVAAAARGDATAWNALVQRFSSMVMAVARRCRLSEADVAEVHQVTWLRLVENIGRIEHPERIGSWLITTAKRESLRVVRTQQRFVPDHNALLACPDPDVKPMDAGPIAAERSAALHEAYAHLPAHCQRLLGLMTRDEALSYKEISALLAMPIGSIGPTRGRCLEHLRRILEQLEANPTVRHVESA